MGSGEVLRVGLVPELIDLKMFWGEVFLDYSKYNRNEFVKSKQHNKHKRNSKLLPKGEEYSKYLDEQE